MHDEVITAAVPSTLDDTWLSFGIWLTETVVADGTNTYAFGAFADGGAAIGDTGEPAAVASVTGDATYQGKARACIPRPLRSSSSTPTPP